MTNNKSVIHLQNANLYLIGPVVFHNNHCTSSISYSVIHVHKGILSLTDYVEFSANKADTIIRYTSNKHCYLMLSEGTLLNVSHNNFTHFATVHSYQILPTTPQC